MSSIYSNDGSTDDGDVIGDALTVSDGLAVVKEIAMVPSLSPSPWPLSLPSPSHHYYFTLLCALTIIIAMKIKQTDGVILSSHLSPSPLPSMSIFRAQPVTKLQNRIDNRVIADLFFQQYILRKFEKLYIVLQGFFSYFLFLRTFSLWYGVIHE